ncbi:hypothetical protein DM860_003942 [Cuscuta australis]|uniref:Uncharacterized protein n=1 Tax=Cuscuta australis TaxID=267555 RepID=A0A328CWQ5_9ASTE|nr:hypothetical protein DM860_003942 [Cuscuta australis]
MACFTACCFPAASNHKKLIKPTNNDPLPSSKKQCLRSLLEADDESEIITMKSSHILNSKDEEEKGTFALDCNQEEDEVAEKGNEKDEGCSDGEPEISTDSSFFSLPLNLLTRRRGGCDEEDEEESLFSLSIDSIRQKCPVNHNRRRDSDQSVQSEPNQIENSGRPRKVKRITPSPLLQEELQEKENLQKLENSPIRRRRRRTKCNKGFGKRPVLGALNWNLISRN